MIIGLPIFLFLAYRLYRWLLRPYLQQFELAQARWRQAHICSQCYAVFIPKEGTYTSPKYLDRLAWNSTRNSQTQVSKNSSKTE